VAQLTVMPVVADVQCCLLTVLLLLLLLLRAEPLTVQVA
jgi:hypothetical protein